MPDLKEKTKALIDAMGGEVPLDDHIKQAYDRLARLDDGQIRQLLLELDEDVTAQAQRIALASILVKSLTTAAKFALLIA